MNVLVNTSHDDANVIATALDFYADVMLDSEAFDLADRYETIVEQTRD